MSAARPAPPPDQAARERIRADLDTTLLVEAAAGTGKTTSLVERMVALVASGRCGVDTLAAVTFTRKAAAELRGRFTAGLERAARKAAGRERARLAEAAARPERCFIGTIHAFCARLLRERPVEAGVPVGFAEVDEDADALLREEAWEGCVAALFASDPPDQRLERLAAVGIEVGRLKASFLRFAAYPDVEEWPAPEIDLGDLGPARAALRGYLEHIRGLLPFPEERGGDRLMTRYERIERLARRADLGREADLMEVLEQFAARHGATRKCWPGGTAQGTAEVERWEAFARETALPAVARWRGARYAAVLPVLAAAAAAYDGLRAGRGVLNYQDLLLRAARLLRDRPHVRSYFRRRFTHLLVDEFQDTDPLQAEVALFLTADDPAQTDWRRCRPAPGALFVVGDPKQSIYRFRRADIATYQEVRRVIEAAGGSVVTLEANFRALPPLIAWGNAAFAPPVFPAEATLQAPPAHPLVAGRAGDAAGELAGLRTVTAPGGGPWSAAAAGQEAGRIARFIRHAIDAGLTVPRTARETAAGRTAAAAAGDFLVVTRNRRRLARYAAALQELGVPHEVTGGSAWGQVEELALLSSCLRALVEPENPVALVAVLRGGLFGLSDAELYDFRRAGGRFQFTGEIPAGLEGETAGRLGEAFGRLRRHAGWLRALPPVAALERIAGDLGLFLRALAAPGGNVRAGTVAKAFAVLRAAQRGFVSAAELADFLAELIAKDREFDGMPARAPREPAVRVMNLHKAKGLEAPVVFLADPGGGRSHEPQLHVDRTSGRSTGYLVVAEEGPHGPGRVLAQPADWEAIAARELAFAAAERTRLLYVAATRAGAMLAVSRREKRGSSNPWDFFVPGLAEAAELPDPGPQRAPAAGRVEVSGADAAAAASAIAARWEAAARPTFAAVGAREIAVGAAELHRPAAGGGEHGAAWGVVIHFLLETAMREPGRDLAALARSALEEQELPTALAEEALRTVEAVRASALWRRAEAAERVIVEAPFAIRLDPHDPLLAAHGPLPLEGGVPGGGGTVPLLVRGVVDLAFREGGRWVLVDWKTDADAARRRGELVARYRGQVGLYAELWERIGGEEVAERGLFFVSSGEYERL